jgi:transposase
VITLPPGARVLLAARPVDFRKGAHSLAALAAEVLREDPFSGVVLVFRSSRADRIKVLIWDGSGLVLIWKQLEGGAFRWPPVVDGVLRLTAVEFAALFDGIDWVRRITDGRQRVRAPYDEGVAIHIGPESCAGSREAAREALTGVRAGQPLSGVTLPNRSADALQSAEGNTSRRATASAERLRVVVRPWHARTSPGREPRGLRPAHRRRAMGRTAKAGSRRP